MTGMTTGQAAVIEPILTTHARGYRNATYVADKLAPLSDIPNRAMRVIKFGKEDFRRVQTRRAPGGTTARVQYGYASDPVALPQDSLEAVVPTETQQEAEKVPGFDLGKISVERVLNVFNLNREIEVATKVRAPSTYAAANRTALAGTDKWSDPASKPKNAIDEARNVIRRNIGQKPNVLVLGPSVKEALTNHPVVLDKFKYTSGDSVTLAMLARYLELDEVVSAEAVVLADGAGDSDAAQDIWGADAVLAYVNRAGDYLSPSFAYTYRLLGYPTVEVPYYERRTKSWIFPVTNEEQAYVTGAEGGFLFQAAA